MNTINNNYDLAVIGAGHAGIEASLAAARMSCFVVVFTINMDTIGNCPCNPSIGGTAKGHLVREIDALGGEMAKTTDECSLQTRILNRSKGPAVHSLRAQIDRRKYSEVMKRKLETQKNLHIKQAEIISIKKTEDKYELTTKSDMKFVVKALILATGTYLRSKIFVGEVSYNSGPDGIFPAMFLKDSFRRLGIVTKRFKTGTPARALKSSLDFSKMQIQKGDEDFLPFSFTSNKEDVKNHDVCYITWTNKKTAEVILKDLKRSVLYNRKIKGIGPRYCPSIEDKIIRFPDKERHQIFVEPCGKNTKEMYLQGLSSSLPEDTQEKFLKTIPGFENIVLTRCAYAIEYDSIDPLELDESLEFVKHPMLFCCGQIAGSSGYEEAASLGIVAGINAARKILKKGKIILNRENSYIGTLIDDMTNKGVDDPYRMMTSRAEYRLVLRQDNADERLTPTGRKIGLIGDERWEKFKEKLNTKKRLLEKIKKLNLSPTKEINDALRKFNIDEITTNIKLFDLLKRPEIDHRILKKLLKEEVLDEILEQIVIEIKYEGYIKRQNINIKKAKKQENKIIPEGINYKNITGLRLEASEKLSKFKPKSFKYAAKISGVTPADMAVLAIYFSKNESTF